MHYNIVLLIIRIFTTFLLLVLFYSLYFFIDSSNSLNLYLDIKKGYDYKFQYSLARFYKYTKQKNSNDLNKAKTNLNKAISYANATGNFQTLYKKTNRDTFVKLIDYVYEEVDNIDEASKLINKTSFFLYTMENPAISRIILHFGQIYKSSSRIVTLINDYPLKQTTEQEAITREIEKEEQFLFNRSKDLDLAIDDLANYINNLINFIIITSLILFLSLFWTYSFFVVKAIIKPIDKVYYRMLKIFEDKKIRFPEESKDKQNTIKALLTHINTLNDYINSLEEEIDLLIETRTKIKESLSLMSEDSNTIVTDINKSFQEEISQTEHLQENIGSTMSLSMKVRKSIKPVVDSINTQSSNIVQSFSDLENIFSSIQNIEALSLNKLNLANTLFEGTSRIDREMQETISIIKKVANSAHLIMDLIEVINSIAEQTDMLAMNAAIEAAHAGSAGKGFAVVADEIRKLAENSAKNSLEISRSLKEIIEDIKTSEEITSKTGDFFVRMLLQVKEVSLGMKEMKTSMATLSHESKQIIDFIASIVGNVDNLKNISTTINHEIEKLSLSFDSPTTISRDVLDNTKGLLNKVDNLVKGIERGFEIVWNNIESAENIKQKTK